MLLFVRMTGGGAYRRLMPDSKYLIGKDLTQNIERNNLNVRTHIKRLTRKRICFSKNDKKRQKTGEP